MTPGLSVELRGFEPLTPCMPCRCATNCATAPSVTRSGNAGNPSGPPRRTRIRGCRSGDLDVGRAEVPAGEPQPGRRRARAAPPSAQLRIASSPSAASSGQPSRPATPTRIAAPWSTTTAVPSSGSRSSTSRRAGTSRSPTCVDRLGALGVDVGVDVEGLCGAGSEPVGELLTGQAGAGPGVVLPQPRVLLGDHPGGLLEVRRGLAGAGEVAGDEQVGPHLGDRPGAIASACSRPVSSRPTSA